MCQGTIYEFICGHSLPSIRQRCARARPCARPAGPVVYLADTCASCHPSHLVAETTRRHDRLLDEDLALAKLAAQERRFADADAVRRRMDVRRRERFDELARARRLARDVAAAQSRDGGGGAGGKVVGRGGGGVGGGEGPGDDVVWPGKVDEDEEYVAGGSYSR